MAVIGGIWSCDFQVDSCNSLTVTVPAESETKTKRRLVAVGWGESCNVQVDLRNPPL